MAGPAYQWGSWRFEPTECRLLRDGELVALPAKTLDVLSALLRRAPRLVTKEEIFAAVWPNAAVEEGNIAFHVAALRKVLDAEDGTSPIETVRGRGYRFVADVAVGQMEPTAEIQRPLGDPGDQPPLTPPPTVAAPHAAPPTPMPEAAPIRRGRSFALPALIVAIVVIGVAAAVWWRMQPEPITVFIQKFEIVNPASGQENFPDGLGPYIALAFDQRSIAIAPAESADLVLSGQLRPTANGFRIDVQLTGERGRVWNWGFDVSQDEERPPASAGPDDVRSRLQGLIAGRTADGVQSYLSLSGAAPVTR